MCSRANFTVAVRFLNRNKLIVCIILVAFAARIVGIGYGLPQQFVADEFLMVAVSLKMLETRSLRPFFPDIFYHQPLTAYLSLLGIGGYLLWQMATGVFPSIAELRQFYAIHASDLLIIVRLLSVLAGTATVFFLYLIGRDFRNRRTGLIAAFFGSVELLSVQFSHTGRVWTFLTFFVAWALWGGVRVLRFGRTRDYVGAALASAGALVTLLPGIFSAIPAVVARCGLRNKKMWGMIAAVIAAVVFALVLNPRGLGVFFLRFDIDLPLLSQTVFRAPQNPGAINPGNSLFDRIADPFLVLFNYAPLYLMLAVGGFWVLWRASRRDAAFLGSFPAAYYLFIGPFFSYGERVRTIVPLMVPIIMLAAIAADRIAENRFFRARQWRMVGFMLIAASYSLAFSGMFDVKILRADTRTQAIEWIYKHLPEDARILVYSTSNDSVNQNRAVLETMREVAPELMNARQRALLQAPDAAFSRPWYFAWDARKAPAYALPEDFFKRQGFQYYLRTRWGDETEQEFEATAWGAAMMRDAEGTFADKRLVAVFAPFSGEKQFDENFANNVRHPARTLMAMERFGPIVEIYEIRFK